MPMCVCPDGCRSYCVDRCAGDESPTPKAATPIPFGIPVSAFWPDHEEELVALRAFRADYDRLMSTEGRSHGEAIAALSGLVVSASQRTSAQPVDLDPIRLRLSEVRGARAGRWDFHRAVGSTLAFNAHAARDVEVLLAEVDRLTAALAECEARCDALADRVTAAEGRLELAQYLTTTEIR